MFCGECGRPVNTKGGRSAKANGKAPVVPAVEPVVVAGPEPLEEPVVEPATVPIAEVLEAPEPLADPEPLAEREPIPDVAPAPEPTLAPDVDLAAATERCAQCGAPLTASDIFCPECGFVRQLESPRSRPSDTNILDPFPWGLPRSTEPVAHQHPPVAFEPDEPPRPIATDTPAIPSAEVSDVSETRLVPHGPRGERFVLQFSTGESVSVSGTGLIGRNPVAEPGEYFDTLVAVVDPGRSVSKTHLEFGQDGTSFWVSDRYSGNGTVVREPDRQPRRCDAGKRYRVARGARVEIGEQFFIVS